MDHVKDYATDGENHHLAIDEETRGLITSSTLGNYERRGELFSYAETITLENGVERDYVLTTPGPTLDISFFAEIEASDICEVKFFKGTAATGGSALVPADLNDRTANDPTVTIAADPTVTDDGTKLPFDTQLGFSGKGNDSFGGTGGGGLLLANSKKYMLRLKSLSANNLINVNLTHVEAVDRI